MTNPLLGCKAVIQENLDKIRVAIVLHENPDPDCIASALGLTKVLKVWNPNIQCSYLYTGEIAHPQNKTFVNVLNVNLTSMNEIEDIKIEYDFFITVDVVPERCLINENKDIECLFVVDHHRAETKRSKFTDIRFVGATSSIIWDYIRSEGIEFQENDEVDTIVATALTVGIKTDTAGLTTENVADIDWQASQSLMGFVNRRYLSSIDNYPIPPYYFDLRRQLDKEENFKMDNGIFVGGIGYITPTKRDAIPTMADERARVEGVETAFVFAIVGNYIEVSVRSQGLSVDVNALCQKIFGKQYAGGKMGSGAAKVPLAFLCPSPNTPNEVKGKIWEAIKAFMIDTVFHIMSGNA